MLIRNPGGHYRFLEGSDPYSCGTVADEGWQVVHATLRDPAPWREGFTRIEGHLAAAGLGMRALCGIELRCSDAYTIEGFASFNKGYHGILDELGLLIDGLNPVARTNVSPAFRPPSEQTLYGFSYVAEAEGGGDATFVVSGAGELRTAEVAGEAIVRRGECSPEAMLEKAACVVDAMSARLEGLECRWDAVSQVNVYTVHHVQNCVEKVLRQAVPPVGRLGVHWYPARPPVKEIEFEMDVRGVRKEIWV